MRRLSGQKFSTTETLLAAIADRLSILVWQNTDDGHKGRNQPQSILKQMTEADTKTKYKTFATGAEFDAALAALREN